MRLFNRINKSKLLLLFITGLFFIEFFTTIYIYYSNVNTTRIVGIYKLVFEGFLLMMISFRYVPKKIKYGLLFLIVTYLINQLLNPLFFENLAYQFTEGSLYYLNRFIFIFIFIASFSSLKEQLEIAKSALRVIEYILFINAILIIFGGVFNIDILSSYPQSNRFGSDGLFNKVNEVSYLYSIYILILYYKYVIGIGTLWKLVFILFASFFIGTKTIVLFIGLLITFHFLFIHIYRKKFRFILIPGLLFAAIFSDKILTYLFSLSPFWRELGENYSLLTLVFSTRDLSVISNYSYVIENWTLLNYFIGGPFYTDSFKRSLMDGVDLLLHFGILSSFLYLYLITYYFFKKKNLILNYLVVCIIFCGFLAGGLFLRIIPMIYLYLTIIVLNQLNQVKSVKALPYQS